jgi:hypothetical protein
MVANMPTHIIDKLNAAAQEVNGLTTEAKADIAKKSETIPSVASSSNSQ